MPSFRVFSFGDPYLYQKAIRAVDGVEVLPTTKGDFRADLTQIDLNRLWMQRGSENLPRILHAAVRKVRVAIEFPVTAEQPDFRYRGINVSHGEVIFHDAHEFDHRSFGPCHWGSMSLTPEDLATAGRALTGRELTPPPATYLIRPPPALMARLLLLHAEATLLARKEPETLTRPEAARSLEKSLVHAMVACLVEGEPIRIRASAVRHSATMKRFEEFLVARQFQPVYLEELCTAIGVSETVLRFCCQEHLGMSPFRYLGLRRMHLAHRALILGDPAKTTVTEIATDHGFWELGRFSIEYRKLFGEWPSATLRRPPGAGFVKGVNCISADSA